MPLPNVNEATRRLNPHLFPAEIVANPEPQLGANKRIKQDSKPLMNALETRLYAYLQREYPSATIRPQAKRYRLGNGIWYKPDFTAHVGFEIAWEAKGPKAFRGGFENLKVAATTYPEIQWWLAWEEEDDRWGRWQLQRVLP